MAIRQAGYGKKIILSFLLLIIVLILSILIIDRVSSLFGIYLPIPIFNTLKKITTNKKIDKFESPYLLEREELSKDMERLKLIEEQLAVRENEITLKEEDVNKKIEALKDKEEDLENKIKIFEDDTNKYKDRKQNIREQAIKIYNMPPDDSVALLEKQTEEDIVDILRELDKYSAEIGRSSLSPYLLSKLEKEKASKVLRMLKYPSGENDTSVESIDETELDLDNISLP